METGKACIRALAIVGRLTLLHLRLRLSKTLQGRIVIACAVISHQSDKEVNAMLRELPPVISTDFALTIDVEDYFHVAAFERVISPDHWDQYPCQIEANVHRIMTSLEAKAQTATKATFFVLGWVAERYPALIREIYARGHEIASHGYHHQRLNHLTQCAFRQDITASKARLEDLIGSPVWGYRAPSFSFDEHRPWIQDELQEAGYRYSSSINPVPHDLYGYRHAPRTPFLWDNGLLEIPVATAKVFNRRIPCAGGGYFRLYPYALSKMLLKKAAEQLAGPVVFYVHPWEVAPDQPRIRRASVKSRFRHYLNLQQTLPRLERLLGDFQWGPMRNLPVVGHIAGRTDEHYEAVANPGCSAPNRTVLPTSGTSHNLPL